MSTTFLTATDDTVDRVPTGHVATTDGARPQPASKCSRTGMEVRQLIRARLGADPFAIVEIATLRKELRLTNKDEVSQLRNAFFRERQQGYAELISRGRYAAGPKLRPKQAQPSQQQSAHPSHRQSPGGPDQALAFGSGMSALASRPAPVPSIAVPVAGPVAGPVAPASEMVSSEVVAVLVAQAVAQVREAFESELQNLVEKNEHLRALLDDSEARVDAHSDEVASSFKLLHDLDDDSRLLSDPVGGLWLAKRAAVSSE